MNSLAIGHTILIQYTDNYIPVVHRQLAGYTMIPLTLSHLD